MSDSPGRPATPTRNDARAGDSEAEPDAADASPAEGTGPRTEEAGSPADAPDQEDVAGGPLETATGPRSDSALAASDTTDAAHPRSSWNRVLSLIEVLLCSGFPTQILVTLGLAALGIGALTSAGQLSLRYIVWLSLVDTVLIVGLTVTFLRTRGESPAQVFLGARTMLREAGVGVLLVPVAFLLVLVSALAIELIAPSLRDPAGNPLAALLKTPRDIALFAAVAVLAGGLREELQRAFVLHRFEQHLGGAPLGLVLFGAAFGLGHAIQGWDAAIMTGWLGVLWGLAYLWRRSVIAPAVCHALFNLIEVVFHGFWS